MKYILSLDQGTTSSRAVLFDENRRTAAISQHEFAQHFPREGWVEHDPMEIWSSQYAVAAEAVAKSGVDPRDIAALGITNQRETTIVWERATGRPIYNAIVWQCRRTAPLIEELKARGLSDMIREKTGLVPDAYFSATKIRWILDHVDGAQQRAEAGDLLFGTVDSWLIWKLTGSKTHAIDRTNASRTMLYNIHDLDWDGDLLRLFNIPRAMLPEVKCSGEYFGEADICGAAVPIMGAAGDQQAALFGQCCFNAGDAKNTYGTGCFLLMNTGVSCRVSENGLVTTVAAGLKGAPQKYALEGSVFVGGAVIQWLRDELRLFSESRDAEYFARKVEDTGGVYLVPAFTGLGAPYWDMYARGTIVGITRGTTSAHITRAALEAIAFEVDDVVRAMAADTGHTSTEMRVDGGAVANSLLMQFQADLTGVRIIRPSVMESTALGAAMFAGLAVGFWHSTDEICALLKPDRTFSPEAAPALMEQRRKRWHEAVRRSRHWVEE